jgi:hypothetical protein
MYGFSNFFTLKSFSAFLGFKKNSDFLNNTNLSERKCGRAGDIQCVSEITLEVKG